MKLTEVRKALTDLGMVIRHDAATREYRVNFRKGREATAYYTDNLDDALQTGVLMAVFNDSENQDKIRTAREIADEARWLA